MRWYRNAIGDIKHVIAKAEADAKTVEQLADSKVQKVIARAECDVLKAIGESFEKDGQALRALGVSIESSGHFDPSGQGNMTITVKSVVTPAAAAAGGSAS
jgi:uncharacterized protein (UPF0264 family)